MGRTGITPFAEASARGTRDPASAIMQTLLDGPRNLGQIAGATDMAIKEIVEILATLRTGGLVELIGKGQYKLTDDGEMTARALGARQ
jgi:Mn-dependent DtxR family transcriptional regulator